MDSPTNIIIFDPNNNNNTSISDSYQEMMEQMEYEYSDDDISLCDDNDNDNDNYNDSDNDNNDNISDKKRNSHSSATVPLSPNRMLLIDELDVGTAANKNAFKSSIVYKKKNSILTSRKRNTTAGGAASSQFPSSSASYCTPNSAGRRVKNVSIPCPCCKAYVCQTQAKKDNLLASNLEENNCNDYASSNSLSSLVQYIFSTETKPEPDLEWISKPANKEASSPDILLEYTVTKTIMETWLYKKGSGRDVFGSTHWKPRWCQLVLATVPNVQTPVPLLLVSWHFSLPKPSTIILLKNKIAIAVNATTTCAGIGIGMHSSTAVEEEEKLPYRFDIVQCHTTENKTQSRTWTFALKDLNDRDAWVYELNEAICQFEKKNKVVMRLEQMEKSKDKIGGGVICCLPPTVPRVRVERDLSAASNLEGLDLVL